MGPLEEEPGASTEIESPAQAASAPEGADDSASLGRPPLGPIVNPYGRYVSWATPYWILKRKDLSWGAKLLYAVLADLRFVPGEGCVTAYRGPTSLDRSGLRAKLGMTESQLKLALKQLERGGLVQVDRRRGMYAVPRHPWNEDAEAPPESVDCWVYFMQAGFGGPIKIGAASDPERRRVDIQIASAEPVQILAVIRGDEVKEAELHAQFAADWIRGEWFRPSEELMRFIEGLLEGGG